MKLWKDRKEFFSIPNILGYFRLILVPVYLVLYFRAQDVTGYRSAAIVLAISGITDMLDGKIARKFNMITEWGKFLDPVADKITQLAVIVSLTFRFPCMRYVAFLLVIKELFMAVMGAVMMKRGKRMNGAQWYGKLCTALLFVLMVVLIFDYDISYFKAGILIGICISAMLLSLCCYAVFYIRMIRGVPEEKNVISIRKTACMLGLAVLIFAIYNIAGALIAYSKQPEMETVYTEASITDSYFSDTVSGDRAGIIEDNEEALLVRVRLIKDARESIVLSTFDFHSDESGRVIMGALMEAADRGVSVRILVDGFSYIRYMAGNPYFYALAAYENIEFKVYNQVNLLTPWKLMGRMHDKYLIADDMAYLLGGRNIYNYFLGDYSEYKNHDRDVLVYNESAGQASSLYQVKNYFEYVWSYKECSIVHDNTAILDWISVERALEDIRDEYNEYLLQAGGQLEAYDYYEVTVPADRITLISNPIHVEAKEPIVWHKLIALMKTAYTRVKLHTPYIICNDMMYADLKTVADSPVQTMLMTNSVANNGNPFGAGDYLKNKENVLATGLDVWEYEGGTSYHCKTILIDDNISVVGSFNMDMRSVYLDTEVMLVIDSKELNSRLCANMEIYERCSRQAINADDYYNPYEVAPIELTDKRRKRIIIIQSLIGWARFLF